MKSLEGFDNRICFLCITCLFHWRILKKIVAISSRTGLVFDEVGFSCILRIQLIIINRSMFWFHVWFSPLKYLLSCLITVSLASLICFVLFLLKFISLTIVKELNFLNVKDTKGFLYWVYIRVNYEKTSLLHSIHVNCFFYNSHEIWQKAVKFAWQLSLVI